MQARRHLSPRPALGPGDPTQAAAWWLDLQELGMGFTEVRRLGPVGLDKSARSPRPAGFAERRTYDQLPRYPSLVSLRRCEDFLTVSADEEGTTTTPGRCQGLNVSRTPARPSALPSRPPTVRGDLSSCRPNPTTATPNKMAAITAESLASVKISFATPSLGLRPSHTLEQKLEAMADAGFKYAELGFGNYMAWVRSKDPKL